MLSAFVRPIVRSCSSSVSDSQAGASWTHFWRRRIVPPAPGLPSGIRTSSGASIRVGFSVPSMNPGQVAVVAVRPARGLLGHRRQAADLRDRLARDVEHDVVGAARDPEHCVVLRRRHREALDAGEVVGESLRVRRCVLGRGVAPELRPEPRHQVDAAHRRPRLPQRRDRRDERATVSLARGVELEVRV
jgi:hypothetical protein